MVSLRPAMSSLIKLPLMAILLSNHGLMFLLAMFCAIVLYSKYAGMLVLLGGLFAWLASLRRRPCDLPQYKGGVDVMLGSAYRASSRTSDMRTNNSVSIASFGEKLVVAYRKAHTHFHSHEDKVIVTFAFQREIQHFYEVWEYSIGAEKHLREVQLFQMGEKLFLYFACLAPSKGGVSSPRGMQWTCTTDLNLWTKASPVGRVSEVVSDVKVRDEAGKNVAYKSSYVLARHAAHPNAKYTLHFEKSHDGENWKPVGKDINADSVVYVGGVSEVSFEFTPVGDLVAIGQNGYGDASGFGSQLFFARVGHLGQWEPLRVSLPQRFDTPRLCSYGQEGELLLIATHTDAPYAVMLSDLPLWIQRYGNMLMYSLHPKHGAVYRLRPPDGDGKWSRDPVQLIRCLDGIYSDNGFYSTAHCHETGDDIIAYYCSSSCHSSTPWVYGQAVDTDVYIRRYRVISRSV